MGFWISKPKPKLKFKKFGKLYEDGDDYKDRWRRPEEDEMMSMLINNPNRCQSSGNSRSSRERLKQWLPAPAQGKHTATMSRLL